MARRPDPRERRLARGAAPHRGPAPDAPYRWDPAASPSLVAVDEPSDELRARLAGDAYGDPALADQLDEAPGGYRLRFELLQPEWRARWQAADADDAPLPPGALRVVRDRPPPGDACSYDPTAALGEPIGALADILHRPADFRAVLDGDPARQVVVALDGETQHLAAPAMTFLERGGAREPLPPPPPDDDAPAPRLSLHAPATDWMGRRTDAPADPLAGLLAPLRAAPRAAVPVGLRQLSVGELRDLVRRHGAQARLQQAGVDAPELVDAVASTRFVTATGRDRGRHAVDTGAHDRVAVAAVGAEPPAAADPAATLDRFDLAIAQVEVAAADHPSLADLLAALAQRLRVQRGQLADDPSQAARCAPMIALQLELAGQASHALVMLAVVLPRHPDGSPLRPELLAIRNLYELALVYSDRGAIARRFYDDADRRMTTIPITQLRGLAQRHADGVAHILADRGDDPALRNLGIEESRADMRAASQDNQRLDATQLTRALADAEAAADTGDGARAERSMQVARFHLEQMEGRHRILVQLHQALIAYQELAHSGALVFHQRTASDEDLVNLKHGLSRLQQRYERDPDPAARAQVLAELDGLWESEADYHDFYAHIHDVVWWSDVGVNLLVLVASILLSGGAAAFARGAMGAAAAATTAGRGGVLVLETLVFTGASQAGQAITDGHDRHQGLADFPHAASGGFGADFATNLGLFLIMRGCGQLWGQLGRDLGEVSRGAGQLATSYAVFETYAVARLGVEQGRLPSAEELAQLSLENAAALLVCHATARAAQPGFDALAASVRARVHGDFGPTLGALEAQRTAIEADLATLLAGAKDGGALDRDGLGAILRRSSELGRRFAETLERAARDPRVGAADRAGLAAEAQANRALADAAGDLTFAARVGWRPVGASGALVNPGTGADVAAFYRARGCTVDVRPTDVGLELRIGGGGVDGVLVVREGRTTGDTALADGWAHEGQLATVAEARRLLATVEGPRGRAAAAAAGDVAIELVDGTGFALRTDGGRAVVELGRDAAELSDPRLIAARIAHELAHARGDGAERGWQADERAAYQTEYEVLRELTGGDLGEFAELVRGRFGRASFDQLLQHFGDRYRALLQGGHDVGEARALAYRDAWDAFERDVLPRLQTGDGTTYAEHYADPGAAPQGEGALPAVRLAWWMRFLRGSFTAHAHADHLAAGADAFVDSFAAARRPTVRAILDGNARHRLLEDRTLRTALLEAEYGDPAGIAALGEIFDGLAAGGGRDDAMARLGPALPRAAGRMLAARELRRAQLGMSEAHFERYERVRGVPELRERTFNGRALTPEALAALSEAQLAAVEDALGEAALRGAHWRERPVDLGSIQGRGRRFHGTKYDSPAQVIADGGLRAIGDGLDLGAHVIDNLRVGLRGTAPQMTIMVPPDPSLADTLGFSNQAPLIQGGPITFAGDQGWVYVLHASGVHVQTASRYRPMDTVGGVVEKIFEHEWETAVDGRVPLEQIEGWYLISGPDGALEAGPFQPNDAFRGTPGE